MAGSLSLVMAIVGRIWMLAPVGIIAGNALIFLYTTLTGNWRHWIFLWIFELWLIAGVVWLTIWLKRHSDRQRQLTRILGRLLGSTLFALGIVVFAIIFVTIVASLLMR
jgi:hypothetical protein